jgi:signal transduction histidine kinase
MNQTNGQIVPFLFNAIFVVIFINLLINICLYYFSQIKNIKAVCWYWGTLLVTYLFQGLLQDGNLPVALGFGGTFLPVCIASKVLFDSIKQDFPLKRFSLIFIAGIACSVALSYFQLPFTAIAMPICFAINVPLIEASFHILVSNRRETTILQKFMAFQYIFSAIHVVNFALHRMEAGTEVVGFGTSLILYFIMSLSLFAFSFEEFSKDEKERLQKMVDERTRALTESFEKLKSTSATRDTLMNVVLHDIANPIQAQLMVLHKIESNPLSLQELLPRLTKFNKMIVNTINQVRSIELINSGKLNLDLEPVDFEQCIRDVSLVFEEQLRVKGLSFNFVNELSPLVTFAANPHAFTNSVMNNLISNAIKFSPVGSKLNVRSFEKNGKVAIEVEDFGVGMPNELAQDIFNPLKKTTRPGTNGESGSGYGLPLAKSYIDHFGGEINVESREIDLYPINHGTKFTVTMEKSSYLH